jgi:hypothetical protein
MNVNLLRRTAHQLWKEEERLLVRNRCTEVSVYVLFDDGHVEKLLLNVPRDKGDRQTLTEELKSEIQARVTALARKTGPVATFVTSVIAAGRRFALAGCFDSPWFQFNLLRQFNYRGNDIILGPTVDSVDDPSWLLDQLFANHIFDGHRQQQSLMAS